MAVPAVAVVTGGGRRHLQGRGVVTIAAGARRAMRSVRGTVEAGAQRLPPAPCRFTGRRAAGGGVARTATVRLLPGTSATRTGLTPASDDEHEPTDHPRQEATSSSAGRTTGRG